MGKTRKDQRSRVVESEGSSKKDRSVPRLEVKRKLHQVDVSDYDELDDLLDELPAFEKI